MTDRCIRRMRLRRSWLPTVADSKPTVPYIPKTHCRLSTSRLLLWSVRSVRRVRRKDSPSCRVPCTPFAAGYAEMSRCPWRAFRCRCLLPLWSGDCIAGRHRCLCCSRCRELSLLSGLCIRQTRMPRCRTMILADSAATAFRSLQTRMTVLMSHCCRMPHPIVLSARQMAIRPCRVLCTLHVYLRKRRFHVLRWDLRRSRPSPWLSRRIGRTHGLLSK